MTSDSTYKPTIHILGGGPSGLSAAFHLTSPLANPDWVSRYDVVVHQLGWRLGGKGATGRSAERAWRVEEHGIHLFGNMYSNSLHMMNETLTELDDGRTMETEFLPSDFQLVTDFYGGRWHGFDGGLPHNDEKPWEHGPIAGPAALLQSIARTIKGILQGQELPVPGDWTPTPKSPKWLQSATHFIAEHGTDAMSSAMAAITDELVSIEQGDTDQVDLGGMVHILERLLAVVESAMKHIAESGDKLRWIFVQLDLLATALRGTIADDVIGKGIDSIDHVDYRTWLTSHGANALTMQSSLLQAIPNTCMQYPDGDSTTLPQMAASAYLTFILRQIMAPGDAAYFFKVGTGETVILPLYEALVDRGVTFEFFHKVTDLVPDPDGSRVGEIVIEVQATTKDSGPYLPLATMPDGQQVWPSAPDFDQLNEGGVLKANDINLESWWADWDRSRDNDDRAQRERPGDRCAPSEGSALLLCLGHCRRPGMDHMISEVRTTPTQALQIWLDKPLSELGWRELEETNRWLGPAYTNPISAFGDFTESIEHEGWPADNTPKGLIYFCGVLQDPATIPDFDDHGFPAQQTQRVRDMAGQYLRQLGGLLPGAANGQLDANSLDFSLLTCYDESTAGVGENRVDQQYYRANIDPNERYTVSAPGTLQYRLKAWESCLTNVTCRAMRYTPASTSAASRARSCPACWRRCRSLGPRPSTLSTATTSFTRTPPDPQSPSWASSSDAEQRPAI